MSGETAGMAAVHVAGLHTAVGDQPFALLGAVGAGLGQLAPHPVLEGPAADGRSGERVLACCAVEEELSESGQRIHAVLDAALAAAGDVLDRLPGAAFQILLPPATTPRGADLDEDEIREWLGRHMNGAREDDVAITREQGLALAVADAVRRVNAGAVPCAVIAVADSLVDASTVAALGSGGRVATTGMTDGICPGEAAAVLVVTPASAPADADAPGALLRGLVVAPSPAAAMGGAARQAGIVPADLDLIVHPFFADRRACLQWHATVSELYPAVMDEARLQRAANGEETVPTEAPTNEPPALVPESVIGHTGVASAAMGLALACARFGFHRPRVRRIGVIEWTEGGSAAFVLENTDPGESGGSAERGGSESRDQMR